MAYFDDREALTKALAGVDTLVLVSSDGEAELVLQHHQNLAAVPAGDGRVALVAREDVGRCLAALASPRSTSSAGTS